MHKPLDQSDLHPDAPEDLIISAEWGEYGERIWEDFEKAVEGGMWLGEPPDHELFSVGSYKGKPALITRNYHSSECEMRLWHGGPPSRSLEVCSNVFVYPMKYDLSESVIFEDWAFIFQKILKGDGEYDIYNEKIPEDLLWVIDEMTGLDEAEREEMELGKFIENEIGGLDKIFDPKVREIIQKKL